MPAISRFFSSSRKWFGPALLCFLLMPFIPPTGAADVAQRRIIGFSEDGRYFAFMQFGVQDGSGAAYAEAFAIDLERDRFVRGTPVRVFHPEDPQPLPRTLNTLKQRAAPLLARLNIRLPGVLLASRAATQADAAVPEIAFHAHYNLRGAQHLVRYRIASVAPQHRRADCREIDAPEMAFRLEVSWGGAPFRPVYAEERVPRSRGCPQRYEIADVVGGPDMDNPLWHVVLVRYYRRGFEGLDGRYLAVPVRLRER